MPAHIAEISVVNAFDGDAIVTLFHASEQHGPRHGRWTIPGGATAGALSVPFDPLAGGDHWSVTVLVTTGPDAGFYVSSAGEGDGAGFHCPLRDADAGQAITLNIGPDAFELPTSTPARDGMTRLAPGAAKPVSHVFVLMLENRSFDHIFAFSGIPGLRVATSANVNYYNGKPYPVYAPAPLRMSTDPGHEFCDVYQQLTGRSSDQPGEPDPPSPHPKPPARETCRVPDTGYPPIDNSGFALCYATGFSEYPYQRPDPARIGDIMACFDTASQLKVTYTVARQSAVCDAWHASLPGPTWPNRFFLHGASSSGLDDSPIHDDQIRWEFGINTPFRYANGSIYDRLKDNKIPYRFYHDSDVIGFSLYSDDPLKGSPLGAIPQVCAIAGVSKLEFHSMDRFARDLQTNYPYPYTFIEPNYGDYHTYEGGSSQHPMDDVYGGEQLLSAVVDAIQKSPHWSSSVLIVCYDEHGGFYDSVIPPIAVPPGDNSAPYGLNQHGFAFDRLGVRVPAMIVSPLVDAGVDPTRYDHSSVCKFLEDLWKMAPLTDRDRYANSPYPRLRDTPRDLRIDLPTMIPPVRAERPAPSADRALPRSGNVVGALANLRKLEGELVERLSDAATTAEHAAQEPPRTFAEAEAYAARVLKTFQRAKQSES